MGWDCNYHNILQLTQLSQPIMKMSTQQQTIIPCYCRNKMLHFRVRLFAGFVSKAIHNIICFCHHLRCHCWSQCKVLRGDSLWWTRVLFTAPRSSSSWWWLYWQRQLDVVIRKLSVNGDGQSGHYHVACVSWSKNTEESNQLKRL